MMNDYLNLPVVVLTIALIISNGFWLTRTSNLQKQIESSNQKVEETDNLNKKLVDQNQRLVDENESVTSQLDNLEDELNDTLNELADDKSRKQEILDSLQVVADDVAVQKKLASLDEELLQKYSNVYFLNENYLPNKLSTIPNQYTVKESQFHADAMPFLKDLLTDASDAGVDLKIASAYRSFGTQSNLKQQYVQTFGETSANRFSADQGYSEHQLGTTVDFTTDAVSNKLVVDFKNTDAYQWLVDHAYQYGFVLSYPDGNQYYQYEPWHWRFVGTELAEHLDDEGLNLYDLDQRFINTFLLNVFD